MVLNSLDAVFYTCIFLVPGYIIKSVIDALIPPAKQKDAKYFFSCLLYSVVNCVVWSWAYVLIGNYYKGHPVRYWLVMSIATIIGASLIGLLLGVIKQKGIIECIFSKRDINKIHPVPTAWDYYFSKQEESWIIVTLKNGKCIYGLFSENSFASSDPDERDIYIEKTYTLGENMEWIEDDKSNGILISKDDIETIEFLK